MTNKEKETEKKKKNCVGELHTIVRAPSKNPSSNFEKLIN